MRNAGVGRVLFALTMMGLGVMGLLQGHFAPVWAPVAKGAPARELLVYFSAMVSLACGAGLLWRRTSAGAARVLLVCLLLWLAAFRLPAMILAPGLNSFWSAGETAVMVGCAWVLYGGLAGEWDRRYAGFAAGEKGLRTARALFGFGLIVFGAGHFLLLRYTASLVPGWLPRHVAFACFTGGALIAAGLGAMTGVCARLAAVLATVEIGAFLVLVWVPILAGGARSSSNWGETVTTWVLMVGAWVMADSYRGMGWLRVRRG